MNEAREKLIMRARDASRFAVNHELLNALADALQAQADLDELRAFISQRDAVKFEMIQAAMYDAKQAQAENERLRAEVRIVTSLPNFAKYYGAQYAGHLAALAVPASPEETE